MLVHGTGTVSFFQAMAPVLIANVLTVAFVYSFSKIHQKELAGDAWAFPLSTAKPLAQYCFLRSQVEHRWLDDRRIRAFVITAIR